MKSLIAIVMCMLIGCVSEQEEAEEILDDEAENTDLGEPNLSGPDSKVPSHQDDCYAITYELGLSNDSAVSVTIPGFCNPFYLETGRPPEREEVQSLEDIFEPAPVMNLNPTET